MVALDPRHELPDVPAPKTLLPTGVTEALRLPKPCETSPNAIAILLQDELKLADQADAQLRDAIRDAIAVLELGAMA
jgi:hypothetical protein